MLTKVEIYNAQGALLSLPLQDVSGGYVVKDISGLDPVKASIVTSPFAKMNGVLYQASNKGERNLIFKIGMDPILGTSSVSVRRSNLYRFFMPEAEITIRFFDDDALFVTIQGRVESFDAPLFTKDPEATISILCLDPDFIAPSSTTINGFTVADQTDRYVLYPGSVESGFVFNLFVDRSVSEFTIQNLTAANRPFSLSFVASLVAGDTVTITTISGQKSAKLTRANVTSSILTGVSPSSSWLGLYPGLNKIRVSTSGTPIPFSIEYFARYGGL